MNKTFDESIQFISQHMSELENLHKLYNAEIIVCPSFPALFSLYNFFAKSALSLGAQSCSPFATGSYTGQVDARSLAQVGCSFCIVGHSEEREHAKRTYHHIAQQTEQLYKNNLIPIICIGETHHEYVTNESGAVLEKQLAHLMPTITAYKQTTYIAYEPLWAIGTDVIPPTNFLRDMYSLLSQKVAPLTKQGVEVRLLYGGSVSEQNITDLALIIEIQGFLIGRASTDFKKLKKIVSLKK